MSLTSKLADIRDRLGPWTAHNIEIAPGLFTISPGAPDRAQQRAALYSNLCKTFLRRDLFNRTFIRMRVLDLGCLEGGIGLTFGLKGANVVGVDIRKGHLEKAEFAAKALGITNRCKWILGDVTHGGLWEQLGKFDLVICSGLLYHLDAADLIPLLRRMSRACKSSGFTLIDTNIAPEPKSYYEINDQLRLWGCHWKEHDPQKTYQERLVSGWSSFHNNQAFWLTERSLINAIVASGYEKVFKPLYPYHEWGHQTRDVWIALPGKDNILKLPLRLDPDPRPWAHPALE